MSLSQWPLLSTSADSRIVAGPAAAAIYSSDGPGDHRGRRRLLERSWRLVRGMGALGGRHRRCTGLIGWFDWGSVCIHEDEI